MDPEHSFDSDTSESWSVIDIIDNEHSNIVELSDGFGSNTVLAAYQWSTSDTIADENCVDLHSQQCGNTVQNESPANCSSNSPTTASFVENTKVQPDCQVLYKGKIFQYDYKLGKISSDLNGSRNSFGKAEKIDIDNKLKDFDNDTDCISIISESECNELKFSAYETDEIGDEKLSEGNKSGKVHPNVLKRKRKRLKLNYRESSEESIGSDFMIPDGKYYSSIENIHYKKSNNEMQVTEYPSAPVYRHYRNHVANTVLTLAMGVIFTGVACIAVGHFLGVHDAQQTAGEMMETLKKLQMENVLLHTRLAQLSRAFFSRGSSKLEFRANVEPQNCLDKYLEKNIHSGNENNLNDVSPIKNSIFFRGGSFDISTNVKEPADKMNYKEQQGYDNIEVSIENHDQPDLINISSYEEKYSKPSYPSTTPAKVEYVYNKFLPLGNNLQDLEEKITPDGQIGQKKIWKQSEEKDCLGTEEQFENDRGKEDCLAVREKDLSRFRWCILTKKKKRKNVRLNAENSECEDAVYTYKFPQPEEFYKFEDENNNKRSDEKLKLNEMFDESKLVRRPRDENTSDRTKSGEKGDSKEEMLGKKKHSSKTRKERKREKEVEDDFDDSKSNESLKKAEEKYQKKNGNSLRKIKDSEDNLSKGSKKYKTESSKKNGKMKECRKKGDRECNFKPHSKKSRDTTYPKENYRNEARKNGRDKEKYLKGEKVKKIKFEKEANHIVRKSPKNFQGKKSLSVLFDMKFANHSNYEGFDNRTARMLYERAKGREKCRRDQKMSEWQFARAKSRADSRIGDAFWQFSRAWGRESSRKEAYVHFRRRDIKHKGFSSDAYSWI